ncbi:MAG: hypothetical protein U1E81_20055 [Xanthobacteraceae bacterium]
MATTATSNIGKLPIQRRFMFRQTRRLQEDIATMNGLVDRLIAEEQTDPDKDKYTDLLHAMLAGVDRETGKSRSTWSTSATRSSRS